MLMTLGLTFIFLLAPLTAQADGLFDFQMKLAEKGNAEAQFKVGEMYETGFGVKQDRKQAENWIKQSYNQGHEKAGFKLLYWDVEKNGINAGNKAKVDELNKKANEGNSQAQYYVGKMHAHGVGLKKDPELAIGWLNKAALGGVLDAERELTAVRENRQRNALAKRRQQEQQQADLIEREKQRKLEEQGDLQAKMQARKNAEAKKRADEAARRQQAAAEAARQKQAAEEAAAAQARLIAQEEAEEKQREAQKQALLKQREAKKEKKKQQFEADPCSGKSARFLSTCR